MTEKDWPSEKEKPIAPFNLQTSTNVMIRHFTAARSSDMSNICNIALD